MSSFKQNNFLSRQAPLLQEKKYEKDKNCLSLEINIRFWQLISFEREFQNRTLTVIESNQTMAIADNEFKYLQFSRKVGTWIDINYSLFLKF